MSDNAPAAATAVKNTGDRYVELHCISNFSFLCGASHPEELVAQAAKLGYRALAITDECSLAGVVKAHSAASTCQLKLIIGSVFVLAEGIRLLLLAPDLAAYRQISALITRARLRRPKGQYHIELADFWREQPHYLTIWLIDDNADNEAIAEQLRESFHTDLWMGIALSRVAGEQQRYLRCYQIAKRHRIAMTACGNVHMHLATRKPLLDVLTAIRSNTAIDQMGRALQANADLHLRPGPQLNKLYPPALTQAASAIADRCHFRLDSLRYQYPNEVVPPGRSAGSFLRELTFAGAAQRWPEGTSSSVQALLEKELLLIAAMRYEHYFLTVYDIVQFARSQAILCQGRGSAANSAVCYCLFITEVDPARSQLLFERFISKERDEPPDIDVDFEHERREEVIQYIYRKYGRQRAALAATVICYRPRSAVRDVGKALGLDQGLIDKLAKSMSWWNKLEQLQQLLGQTGVTAQLFLQLVEEIQGFPRHLSQHVGGFIISSEAISQLVPLENAAMDNRTIIQWDKTDLESLGLMKVDILALGMLSAIRKSLSYIGAVNSADASADTTDHSSGTPTLQLQQIPAEDRATYAMLCQADTIGVFQIESRAQMSMLPRLRPQTFYDLVIQIAIIRPGPIQGGMVHPFLRRRQGLESVTYANEALREVLARTLGVPIFQEQVIKLAMVAAGFSGGEADQLRRAMTSWGKNDRLDFFRDKLVDGMLARGYTLDFAERLFNQMKGFGAYGFPESHSASFALLAYASSWLKYHHPGAFYCGLLNSQPMGFYAPAQLVQAATRQGVTVLPVCVNYSDWDHQLSAGNTLRLGFRLLKGLHRATAERLSTLRSKRLFQSMADLLARTQLNRGERNTLVRADAFRCFDSHRYQSQWQVSAVEEYRPLLASAEPLDDGIELAAPSEVDDIRWDYSYSGLTLRRHPLALLRDKPSFRRCVRASDLSTMKAGSLLHIAGLVTCRQRPGSAGGVLFITLEDETGYANIIVWKNRQQAFRQAIISGRLLLIRGALQRSDKLPQLNAEQQTPVIHVVASVIEDLTAAMPLDTHSHDFH